MAVYLLKRFLVMAITLVGIIVLTFAISRMTPGDPAMLMMSPEGNKGGSEGLSDENIRETRRVMGLDRPLLLNFRFEDRRWHARDTLDRYLRGTGFWRDSARFELGEVNTIVLFDAIDRLGPAKISPPRQRDTEKGKESSQEAMMREDGSTDEKRAAREERMRDDLLAILPVLARESPDETKDLTREKAIEYWTNWAERSRDRLSDAAVKKEVAEYLDTGSDEAFNRVTATGGLALAPLMRALLGSDAVRRDRALHAAQMCANKPASWSVGPTEEQTAESVRRWGSWWNRSELRFVETSGFRDFLNIFGNTQFGLWMRQFLTLDFGISTKDNRPVIDILKERLPVTLQISGLAVLLTYILAVPLGVFSATHQNSLADRALTLILFLLYSVPVFWLAQMLILTLTGGHGWPDLFPSRGLSSEGAVVGAAGWPWWKWGLDRLWHLALPVAAETVVALAFLSRQMRVAMLETIRQDFIQTARAKGLREGVVIYKHALRNSLIPIVTLAADLLPALIGGSVVIEYIFSLNGMGMLAFEAILNRNYPVINCVFAFSALLTLVGILLADIGYALVDPRIRYK